MNRLISFTNGFFIKKDLAKSLKRAFLSVFFAVLLEAHLRIQLFFAVVATILGFYFCGSLIEWMFLFSAIFAVIITELINTNIENFVDLIVKKQFDVNAKKIKDLSSGIVLVACIYSLIIGIFIYFI